MVLKRDELPLHCTSKTAKHLHFTDGETVLQTFPLLKWKGQELSLFSISEKILSSKTKQISSQFHPVTENT